MKKLISIMVSAVLLLTTLCSAATSQVLASGSAMPTSTGFRFGNFDKVFNKYKNLRMTLDETYAIPGLVNTNVNGQNCDTMVPQGVCVVNNYILISAYCGITNFKSDLTKKSRTAIITKH